MTIRGKERKAYEVAPECTTIKSWPAKSTVSVRYEEMNAAELIGDHLHMFYKSDLPKWKYDNDQWTPIGKG